MLTELRTMTDVTGSPPNNPPTTLPDPLGHEFAAGRGLPLLRIEFVDRLQVEQRFQRGHDRDRRRPRCRSPVAATARSPAD